MLTGEAPSWADVNAGVPQASILDPLLFPIHTNNLTDGLASNTKLFPNNTSLFSVVHNVYISASELNNDLVKMNKRAYQWKMIFVPDSNKQAKEVTFSR